MVYIPPQLVIGGLQAAAGIFGASAKQRSANDAARRDANVRNRNALRTYAADLDNYKRQVKYQTDVYNQQKVQYQQQLQFNNQYLQEAYNESQLNLQNLLDLLCLPPTHLITRAGFLILVSTFSSGLFSCNS